MFRCYYSFLLRSALYGLEFWLDMIRHGTSKLHPVTVKNRPFLYGTVMYTNEANHDLLYLELKESDRVVIKKGNMDL